MVRYSFRPSRATPASPPRSARAAPCGYTALPAAQQGQWYYAAAAGDLDHDGVYSRFEVSSLSRELTIIGEETE